MSRLIGRLFLFTILSMFNALFTQAMNCEQAASPVEKTICANPEVKAADEELNRQYKAALKAKPKKLRANFMKVQKTWLGERNGCGANQKDAINCLKKKYADRIGEIFNGSFTEVSRKEIMKNADFKISKISLADKIHLQSCVYDYLSVELSNPASHAVVDELLKHSFFEKPSALECEDENSHPIDNSIKLDSEALGTGKFMKVSMTYAYINGTNQHGARTEYFDLRNGRTIELKKFLTPTAKTTILKSTFKDPESSKSMTVGDYFKERTDPNLGSFCEDREMNFQIQKNGKVEIEVCPEPPLDSPVVELDWKQIFQLNETTRTLFGK